MIYKEEDPMDQNKVWSTVLISWMFTIMGVMNVLFITILVGLIAFRFTGRVTAISLMSGIIATTAFIFLFSEVIVNILMRASKPAPEEYGNFIAAVENICKKKKMWLRPRIYILQLGVPNAMAYGWGILGQSAIGITPEIYELLTKEELEGVIAHEIAHVRCKDVGLHTFISILIGGTDKLKDMFLKGKTALGRGPFAFIFGGMLWFVSKVVFAFLKSAISQERELAADALGSSYVGTPDPLISALKKLAASRPKNGNGSIFKDLMISHPTMEERISSLQRLKRS